MRLIDANLLAIALLAAFKQFNCNKHIFYNTKTATSDLDWTLYPAYNGWEEVSSLDLDGNTIRSYQVCNTGEPNQNNWARSPFIDANFANRIYIEIEFSVLKCPECRETFTLYYYPSSSDVASSTFPPWRQNPYVKLDTIAANERFHSDDVLPTGINRKTVTIESLSRRGFYLAVQDEGACMSVMSVKLYYFYCPETIHNMAYFPKTPAGGEASSLVAVTGKCVSNAVYARSQVPLYHCNSNGQWKVPTSYCKCKPGHRPSADGSACNDCPLGLYKRTSGNHNCSLCPSNSETPSSGSTHCPCIVGYFRASKEPVYKECTRPPSGPLNLTYHLNGTSIQLQWSHPFITGGRDDLYYSVACEECDALYEECKLCSPGLTFHPADRIHVTSTSFTIDQLEPFINYQFTVTSYNGVSSVSPKAAAFKKIQVTRSEHVPSKVEEVVLVEKDDRSLTVVWEASRIFNELVGSYEVRVQQLSGSDGRPIGSSVNKQIQGLNFTIDELTQETEYQVQVRGRSAAVFGQYSDPVAFKTLAKTNIALPNIGNANTTILIAGASAGVVLLVVVLLTAVLVRRRKVKKEQERMRIRSKLSDEAYFPILGGQSCKDGSSRKTYVDYRDPHQGVKEVACEIKPSQVKIERVIGQGEFAEVCRGKLTRGRKSTIVAVKRLRYGASLIDQTNFLREACTMAQFFHPNVLQFKGVVTKSVPPMIVTEFMDNGSLDQFLQKRRGELSMLQLLKMLKGIASGMSYLSSINFIHRDLAARNILVDSDLVCKVSDFGLSRILENNPHATYTTQGGKIALRWAAPECTRCRQFTSSSDVWSFGVLMWEVMSYGDKPYWDMSNEDVAQVIEDGYRLPAPSNCPRALHTLMLRCWSYEAKKRPNFQEILSELEKFIRKPSLLVNTTDAFDQSETLSSPKSSTCHRDVTDVDQWLDMVASRHQSNLESRSINDVESLSRVTTSDLERLGIISPDNRNRMQVGLESFHRQVEADQVVTSSYPSSSGSQLSNPFVSSTPLRGQTTSSVEGALV